MDKRTVAHSQNGIHRAVKPSAPNTDDSQKGHSTRAKRVIDDGVVSLHGDFSMQNSTTRTRMWTHIKLHETDDVGPFWHTK